MPRLSRDFSGRAERGHVPRAKAPAYGRELMARRGVGEYIGLVLLVVDDWQGGREYQDRDNVARLVCPEELDIGAADLSMLAGLDVLVCGATEDARFDAAVLASMRAGAASVWGQFADAIWRVEFWPYRAPHYIGITGPVFQFGRALDEHRRASLLLRLGIYADDAYTPVRNALLAGFGLNPDLSCRDPRELELEAAQRAYDDALGDSSHAAQHGRGSDYEAAREREATAWRRLQAARAGI